MLKIKSLNRRQESLVSLIQKSESALSPSVIFSALQKQGAGATRMTINRDLRELVKRGYLARTGLGRSSAYAAAASLEAIKVIDVDAYFKVDPDKRKIQEFFNFKVFDLLKDIFDKKELEQLNKENGKYLEKLKKQSPAQFKREYERLTVELAWKSSHIEGNTYTLLETEYLLREHKNPAGHTKEETAMILNHKIALDFIRGNPGYFKELTVRKIEEVHSLLIKDLGVPRNIRQSLVRVGGTAYRPLDNKFQIREALEKMCVNINKQKHPFAKAMIAMLVISYIQPFEDGNKRTSRLIGNALLLAYNICPLSFRSLDELEYKKAILLFYEQNNYWYFKELFIQQFEFAVENYFG